MPNLESPLVSFILLAYNQEHYIREAVEGAFSQTYSPLEIILSDDCSIDGTFEIMREMAQNYRGRHKLILNKNPKNLGIGGHVNRTMELANGTWIVIAAGDDQSVPERTKELSRIWNHPTAGIRLVYSDYLTMGQEISAPEYTAVGRASSEFELIHLCKNHFKGVTGASNCWHRELFDYFGPMLESVSFEDRVLAFRAALLGGIAHMQKPLVRYRRHDSNTVEMFHNPAISQTKRMIECLIVVYENNRRDLDRIAAERPWINSLARACHKAMQRELGKLIAYRLIANGKWNDLLRAFPMLIWHRGNPLAGIKLAARAMNAKKIQTFQSE